MIRDNRPLSVYDLRQFMCLRRRIHCIRSVLCHFYFSELYPELILRNPVSDLPSRKWKTITWKAASPLNPFSGFSRRFSILHIEK